MRFSIFTACRGNHDDCSTKREGVEHSTEGHEMAMKKRGALGWRGGTHEAYEALFSKRRVLVER